MTMHDFRRADALLTATLRVKQMDWYALRTMSRGEIRAGQELRDAGITEFTPTFKRWTLVRHTKGRAKEVTHALMPGYLFARLDFGPHSHHPSLLESCKLDPVKPPMAEKPYPVRDKELEQLQRLCAAGAFDQGTRRGHDNRFKDGDMVRITDGPLRGVMVTFRETADGSLRPRAGHVKVMLDRLFGCAGMLVDVEQELVEAA